MIDPSGLKPVLHYFIHKDFKHYSNRAGQNKLLENRFQIKWHHVDNMADIASKWNSLGNKIDTVVIHGHGNSKNISGMDSLSKKTIDTLLLLTCNSGHQDVKNNPATRMLTKHSIRQLVACDGEVWTSGKSKDSSRIYIKRRDTGNDFLKYASNVTVRGKTQKRDTKGFMLYKKGTVKSLKRSYGSVHMLLKTIGK